MATTKELETQGTLPKKAARSGTRLFAGLVAIWLILAAIGFYGYQDHNLVRFEEQARQALMTCRNAQLIYRNDPFKGKGSYADSMETLGLTLFEDGNVTPDSPAYRIETSPEGCTAKAIHPEMVKHPGLRIDYRSAEITPLP